MPAFRVRDRENEQAWKDLFDDLKARGVKEIGLWVSDGNQAMLNAIAAKFGTAPTAVYRTIDPVTNTITFLTGSSLHLYNAEAFTRFFGGFDIYASEPLTPSCFLFNQ